RHWRRSRRTVSISAAAERTGLARHSICTAWIARPRFRGSSRRLSPRPERSVMGRLLVPATMVASLLAFAAAALTVGRVPEHPTWWRAAVALAVLGGVTPMIYAVNIRVIPVFG